MNGYANSSVFSNAVTGWSTLFAQEPDQDLEFDEGLEEDDLNQHKPPSRRPLLWILILLIAVGVMYWTMKPDLAKLPELPNPSDALDSLAKSPSEPEISHQSTLTAAVPTPQFGEGDTVTLSLNNSDSGSSMTLTSDAAGIKPGPRIKTGEVLTIIDGETVHQEWVYHISTLSGKRGWISEKHLQKTH